MAGWSILADRCIMPAGGAAQALPGPIGGSGKDAGLENKPTNSLMPTAIPPPAAGPRPRWPRLTAVAIALSVLVLIFAILVPPAALPVISSLFGSEAPTGSSLSSVLLDKADLAGYAVCHRIPERSFSVAGRQFPLCARCTGTFLGILLGLAWIALRRRSRASGLPPIPVLMVLLGFVGLWAFDGLNSYLTFFPGVPHLYEPRNWLRMTTGVLNGLALILFVYPIYSFTLLRNTASQPVMRSVKELGVLLPVAALLVVLTQTGIDLVLYPLAIASSIGVGLILTLINSMLVAVVLGREGYAQTWAQAWVPLSIGAALAIVQIAALDLLRAYLTVELALPF
jgi:uncharacterized membrane protein